MTAAETKNDGPSQAAEYVLGLMAPEQVAAFKADLLQNPDLRDEVAYWQTQFVTLTDDIPAATPPRAVFTEIEKRLFADRQSTSAVSTTAKAASGGLAWLRFLLGGVAAALAVAVLIVFAVPAPVAGPTATAELVSDDGGFVIAASFAQDTGILTMERLAGAAPEGRVLELWMIAENAQPVSLGVWPPGNPTTLTVVEGLRGQLAGATLAVSEEPVGGSTTGAPTGAVLALGAFSIL